MHEGVLPRNPCFENRNPKKSGSLSTWIKSALLMLPNAAGPNVASYNPAALCGSAVYEID